MTAGSTLSEELSSLNVSIGQADSFRLPDRCFLKPVGMAYETPAAAREFENLK